jgi:hypothetical protein
MLRRREGIVEAAVVRRRRCERVGLAISSIASLKRRSRRRVLRRLRPRRRHMLRRLREGVAAEGVGGRGRREGVGEGVRRRSSSAPY